MDRDPNYTPFGQPAPDRSAPTLVETCWRMRSKYTQRILECTITRDDAPGFEVRGGYSADDMLYSRRVGTIADARTQAARWREAILAKGGFEDVATDDANSVSDPAE